MMITQKKALYLKDLLHQIVEHFFEFPIIFAQNRTNEKLKKIFRENDEIGKFKTFSKFANILNVFSRELGPPFFGVMKALQLKLDLILSMSRYTINGPRAIHNDYTNSFYDWMREMFSVDEVNKKVNGQIVQLSHQKMLISEEEFMALCEKRERMEFEFPSISSTSSATLSTVSLEIVSSDSSGQPPPQQFLLSSEGSSSGIWSEEEIVMQQ